MSQTASINSKVGKENNVKLYCNKNNILKKYNNVKK